MNAVLEQIENHRSIRQYENKPIDDGLLLKILAAGTRASSSGNMKAYSIIITKDEQKKQSLYPMHFQQNMTLEAPVLLTFCSDFFRMREWLKLSGAPLNFDNFMSFMIGAIDAILVAQNVALAAESVGLGVCFMGTTLANCKKIADLLECPNFVVPVVGFSLGYPYLQNSNFKERLENEGIENLAQVYTKLKYTKESHVEYSKTVLGCLKERGFFGSFL